MAKYITGVYLRTYDTKKKALDRAVDIAEACGVDVPIFKQVDTVTAVKDEEA